MMKEKFLDVEFGFIGENLGFSRGCNVGIRAALARADCDYVLLLNSDAIVTLDYAARIAVNQFKYLI